MTIIIGFVVGLFAAFESQKVLLHQNNNYNMYTEARDHENEPNINIKNSTFAIAA